MRSDAEVPGNERKAKWLWEFPSSSNHLSLVQTARRSCTRIVKGPLSVRHHRFYDDPFSNPLFDILFHLFVLEWLRWMDLFYNCLTWSSSRHEVHFCYTDYTSLICPSLDVFDISGWSTPSFLLGALIVVSSSRVHLLVKGPWTPLYPSFCPYQIWDVPAGQT